MTKQKRVSNNSSGQKNLPMAPNDSSWRQNQAHTADFTLRVTSDEPLTQHKIDSVKKWVGSDHSSLSGLRLEVVDVRGSGATSPPLDLRSQSAAPPVPAKPWWSFKRQDPQSKHAQVVQPPRRILFYHAHDPYYGFTNFSPDPVEYKGKRYPTSEHLFQSLKFLDHRPELAEHIRICSNSPRFVFNETHRFNPEVRPDWLHVRVKMMDLVLWHKFTQNKHLKRELLSTGDAELVEDSDKDAFWGVGPDGKGENQLGKALERLRAQLRDGATAKPAL